mmetsp:Transcript_40682/g.101747  ORF Transcript_40682/g.101747 Transcript_40682/m.101747 type:complete len:134 (+) Transcript_40682:38-439(+)
MFDLLVSAFGTHASFATHTSQLPLTGGQNEVWSSVSAGGAPWSADYLIRPVDGAGLSNEGGSRGPYACDTDGFNCYLFDNQSASSLYTNFGTGNETSHPRTSMTGGMVGGGGKGVDCPAATDCNGVPKYHPKI